MSSSTSLKPITLHSHATGPNPWKVAIILNELSIPHSSKLTDFSELHKPPYEKINPNGRVPAIEDPNTGITLWESGAIIEYLIDTYDKSKTLTYTSSPEKYQLQQWLHYQMSGQGPYYGQGAWFTHFHSEKLPSARERYMKEIKRVMGVIDSHLQQNNKQYLVGNKCTYADLAFVTWHSMVPFIAQDDKIDDEKEFPAYHAWMERLMARPAVKKTLDEKAKAMSASKQ